MSLETQITEMGEKLNDAFLKFKSATDKKLEDIDKYGQITKETNEQIVKIQKDIEEFDGLKSRLEKIELGLSRPTPWSKLSHDVDEVEGKHMHAFNAWFRSPKDFDLKQKLILAEHDVLSHRQLSDLERKDVTTTVTTSGGHAVPTIIETDIEKKVLDARPLMSLYRRRTAGTPNTPELVNVRGTTYGWVGETDTRSATSTSSLQKVTPTFGILYAYPQATEESLDDIFFDVRAFVTDECVEAFVIGEGDAYISGDGSSKPTGWLTGTPVTTGDEDSPARAFGTLQYFPTGKAGGFQNDLLTSPPGDPTAVFWNTAGGLKSQYAANAVWVMRRLTLAALMKIRSADGDPLITRNMEDGFAVKICGSPVVQDEGMPAIGSNAFSVAYGDFSGYSSVQLVGLRTTLDEVTTPGYLKFYIRKRVGGILRNDDKIKVIKLAAS